MENDKLIKHLQNTIENQRLIIEGLRWENTINGIANLIMAIVIVFLCFLLLS